MNKPPICCRCGGVRIAFYGKEKRRTCKDCHRADAALRRGKDPSIRRRRGSDPKAKTRYRLKYRYGISLEAYEAAAVAQQGKCPICRQVKRLVVDHCHATGKFRGLLCVTCNAFLGRLEDPKWMNNAAAYLSKGSGQT